MLAEGKGHETLQASNWQKISKLIVYFCVLCCFEKEDFFKNLRILSCPIKKCSFQSLVYFWFFVFQNAGSQLCFRFLRPLSEGLKPLWNDRLSCIFSYFPSGLIWLAVADNFQPSAPRANRKDWYHPELDRQVIMPSGRLCVWDYSWYHPELDHKVLVPSDRLYLGLFLVPPRTRPSGISAFRQTVSGIILGTTQN